MPYPEKFIKGIPDDKCIYEDGTIATHLFHFHENSSRKDDNMDQSINWYDDENAITHTLNQINPHSKEIHFKEGLVTIVLDDLEWLNKRPGVNNILNYERQPLDQNPYHGNLLIHKDIPKKSMKKISAGIALLASQIIR